MRFPIHIELQRSRLLLFVMLLVHALAAGCVFLLPWPLLPRGLLLALIACSALWAGRSSRVVGLCLAASGELVWLLGNGDQRSVVLHPDSVVFSHLVVLRLADCEAGKREFLILLPDSISAEQFRLLRVWLRWRKDAKDGFAGVV